MSPPSTISDVPGLSTKPQACVPAGVWTCPSERGAAPLGHTHGEMARHLRAPWPQATRGPRGPRRARHWALPQRHLRHALTGVCCAHIPVRRHQPPPPVVRGHTLGCTGRSGPRPRPLPEAPRRAGPGGTLRRGPTQRAGPHSCEAEVAPASCRSRPLGVFSVGLCSAPRRPGGPVLRAGRGQVSICERPEPVRSQACHGHATPGRPPHHMRCLLSTGPVLIARSGCTPKF